MDEQSPSNGKRLNPFAFPAETDQRFVLFAIAAVSWVANWAGSIGMVGARLATGTTTTLAGDLWWQVALPVAVVVLATVVYLSHPRRIIRQQKLLPLDLANDAAFSAELGRLADVAHLPEGPALMLRKANRTSGQAFGLRGHRILRLDDGLRLQLRRAPQAFRAVVLHEMAHIANRDIGRSYFAQGLWIATRWLTVAPYLVLMVVYTLTGPRIALAFSGSMPDLRHLLGTTVPPLLLTLFQLVVGLLMAAAIYGSLLRVREAYADWRAATWGAEEALIGILQRSGSARDQAKTGVRERISGWLRLHPTAAERLRFLREPDRFFQVTWDVPLFVGWLVSTIIFGALSLFIQALLGLLRQFGPGLFALAMVLAFVPFLVIGFMVMRSLGLQILRQSVGSLHHGNRGRQPYAQLLLPALWMVCGLYIGLVTSEVSLRLAVWSPLTFLQSALVLFPLTWMIVWSCLAGAQYFGRLILGSHTGSNPPVWKRRMLITVLSTLLGLSLLLWLLGQLAFFAGASDAIRLLPEATPGADAGYARDLMLGVLGLFAFLYLFTFTAGWVMTKVWRRTRPPRCPQCHVPVHQKIIVGRTCQNCGAELTPWLFVN